MPGRDGTGPNGLGPMTGRGLGACTGVNAPFLGGGPGRGFRWRCWRPGFARGWGRGFGWGFNAGYAGTPSKEMLQARKEQLQNMIDAIDRQIESL